MECQRTDRASHRYVCKLDLADRLRGMCDFFVDHRGRHGSHFLSGSCLGIEEGSYVSAFGYDKNDDYWCVICCEPITYDRPMKDICFIMNYKDNKINCYRCDTCQNTRKLLCITSFLPTDKCQLTYVNKIVSCFMYLKFVKVLPEISAIIALHMYRHRHDCHQGDIDHLWL